VDGHPHSRTPIGIVIARGIRSEIPIVDVDPAARDYSVVAAPVIHINHTPNGPVILDHVIVRESKARKEEASFS